MKSGSLRLRLLATAGAAIATALFVAFIALSAMFERHVERRYGEQLDMHVQSLAARLTLTPELQLALSRPLSDTRFNQPLSGVYWAVTNPADGTQFHSRSLWDRQLPPPGVETETGRPRREAGLLVAERRVRLIRGGEPYPAVLQAAMDDTAVADARHEFNQDLALSLIVVGIALSLAAWFQVEVGLRPLERLRSAADRLDDDPQARLPERHSTEVLPLVAAINRLLDARAASIQAAQARAGDLAHGLKTPLSALRNQAGRLSADGHEDAAAALKAAVTAMERQVDRELTRVRAAAAAEAPRQACRLHTVASQLIRVVSRTTDGEGLTWRNEVPEDAVGPISHADLAEALGAILDNAARHARGQVRVSVEDGALVVEDDGPGMDENQRQTALRRGVRLDERGGAGLGLAIASEVLAAYDWSLNLEKSPLGGLLARLSPKI
ncbi:HAMP domain-containing sensor histidine kinase [Caulobacter sp. 73W]|uniref:histidine kinase n=1 Tax=Caulobacter sp. 73W TaxID=3161137 RepID=A0AB39KWH5_9CAUL